VPDPSVRLLRLLSLLQVRPGWTGPALAERLSVTTRTIRHDVERLRALGYVVHSGPGPAGGYRLDAGRELPPLVLDEEQAVAVAVGLRTVAAGTVAGMEEASLRALVSLERLLPSRLRHRLRALTTATEAVPARGPSVDPTLLTAVATAVRDRESLRFDYTAHDGTVSRRRAEPHRLVHLEGRWYLAAHDVDRDDWRTFRLDRVELRVPNGPRFVPRDEPPGGLVSLVESSVARATWGYRATVTVQAPASYVSRRLPHGLDVEPLDQASCRVELGSDDPRQLALWLGLLDADFSVSGSPELRAELAAVAERYRRAAGVSPG
jgi:predicted DNA-binding transcriptional regulator YafY